MKSEEEKVGAIYSSRALSEDASMNELRSTFVGAEVQGHGLG